MPYKVRLTRPAEADAEAAFERISEVAPDRAEAWISSLFAAIMSLTDMPGRCPLIPEAAEINHPARQLIYGRKSGMYRVIFDIQETSDEGPLVRVLRIRHGARAPITACDADPLPHS